jgi:phenylacetate-CoA ligase
MNRLQRLIIETARHVPFYRTHWSRAGVDVHKLELPKDLARLPVVRKSDLLAAGVEARLDDRRSRANLVAETTSGSSGQPFEILIDRSAVWRRRVRFVRALCGAGYRPGERLLLVTSRHATPLGVRLIGWTYASLKQGEDALVADYLRARPAVVYGPLSSLLALGNRLAIDHPNHHRPRLVVATAEELTPAHHGALARAFCDRIADFYGMTEVGLVAWRRDANDAYRSAARNLLLELLPCPDDGALERLVITDVAGGAMPLIRYETGDLVRRDRSLPGDALVRIAGREIDCLRLPGGRRISPYRITTSLELLEGVDQYEVVQNQDLSVDVLIRTSAADVTRVFERARRAVNHVCDGALPLAVKPLPERVDPARKLRPVRSLAKETA